MALKSPLMPSPTNALSAFSPYSDSPNSPAPFGNFTTPEKRSSAPSESLAPPPSPYPTQVDPSPVDSNGSNQTESTEIEEEAQEDAGLSAVEEHPREDLQSPDVFSPDIEITSPQSSTSDRMQKIDTQLPPRIPSDDEPQSVIHAPSGFKNLEETKVQSPTEGSENTVVSPSTPEAALGPEDKKLSSVSPVNTDIPRINDRTTPRAATRQETESRSSMRTPNLEDIPETNDKEGEDSERPQSHGLIGDEATRNGVEESLSHAEEEVASLRTALSECWTLCNTLANLSSQHRQRTFKYAKKQVQEQAWRSCWRLCQQLYDSRDEDHAAQVLPTLELCRDFCQSLFEARQKPDEASDSVLRVSFELNNHLYNTNDRTLPDAFSERTLDFYITLCHRLMKQRTSLPQETDALLRACWNLAEMLFNLRQSQREGKSPDEELLGSAIQACWELCDLFREGWTQIRPDRGTPRPSQTSFRSESSIRSSSAQSGARSTSSLNSRSSEMPPSAIPQSAMLPETPSTIFDDASTATSSPDGGSVPHILVLGPGPASQGSAGTTIRGATHLERWSSNASISSGYSESASATSSQRTSSTATANSEEAHLIRLRCLLLKAGMNIGFSRISGQSLPTYVQTLPKTAFGSLPWQEKVFGYYKNLVMGDKSVEVVHTMPSRRLGANEVAKSVRWLGNGDNWAWMRDLYRIVFGFGIDEAERRGGSFQI